MKKGNWAASWLLYLLAQRLGIKQPRRRPRIDANTRIRVILRDGRCAYCNRVWTPWGADGFQIDHVVPVFHGGPNRWGWWSDNLRLACTPCNQRKSADLGWKPSQLPEWRAIWLNLALMVVLLDLPVPEDFVSKK